MRTIALASLLASLLAACDGSSGSVSTNGDGAVDPGAHGDLGTDGSVAPPFLGANVEEGGVVFRVWAPHATAARVDGSFPSAPLVMNAVAGGVFEAHAPGAKAGDTYSYSLDGPTGTVSRVDPYCRELSGSDCVVIDPSSYAWTVFSRPSRAASVVYEMHIGSFAVASGDAYGTFAAASDALAPLADLGVNVIEVMPIQDFGGDANGWGYNPQLFLAPKPDYGSADDLRAFVDRAHSLGIAVWMDTVVNHTDGWSHAPLHCFDGDCADGGAGIYFFGAGPYATTPWGPRPNYAEPAVATMLLAAVDTWIDEFHGDGLRWDSVSNIRALDGAGTTPGGEDLLVAANAHAHARGAFSIAEDLKGYGAITQSSSDGGFGFDAQWDGFGYEVTGVLTTSSDASRDLGSIAGALTGTSGGDPFARLLYTENHDTVGNGGSRIPDQIDPANPTSLFARARSMLGSVLLLTTPGVPMLFQGQESLATGTFASPAVPLPAPTAQGLLVRNFYKDMIRLRRNLDGGAGGLQDANVEIFHRNDAAKVIGYRRYGNSGEDVIVLVNLMNKSYTEYDIGVADAGPWKVRLDTASQSYGTDLPVGPTGTITATAGDKDGKPFVLPLALRAYSAIILTH